MQCDGKCGKWFHAGESKDACEFTDETEDYWKNHMFLCKHNGCILEPQMINADESKFILSDDELHYEQEYLQTFYNNEKNDNNNIASNDNLLFTASNINQKYSFLNSTASKSSTNEKVSINLAQTQSNSKTQSMNSQTNSKTKTKTKNKSKKSKNRSFGRRRSRSKRKAAVNSRKRSRQALQNEMIQIDNEDDAPPKKKRKKASKKAIAKPPSTKTHKTIKWPRTHYITLRNNRNSCIKSVKEQYLAWLEILASLLHTNVSFPEILEIEGEFLDFEEQIEEIKFLIGLANGDTKLLKEFKLDYIDYFKNEYLIMFMGNWNDAYAKFGWDFDFEDINEQYCEFKSRLWYIVQNGSLFNLFDANKNNWFSNYRSNYYLHNECGRLLLMNDEFSYDIEDFVLIWLRYELQHPSQSGTEGQIRRADQRITAHYRYKLSNLMFGKEETISEILNVMKFDEDKIAQKCRKKWIKKYGIKSVVYLNYVKNLKQKIEAKLKISLKPMNSNIDWTQFRAEMNENNSSNAYKSDESNLSFQSSSNQDLNSLEYETNSIKNVICADYCDQLLPETDSILLRQAIKNSLQEITSNNNNINNKIIITIIIFGIIMTQK